MALGVISLKDFFEDIKEVRYHYILWGKNNDSLFMILFYSSINFTEKKLFSLKLQFPWINFTVKADNLKKKSKQYSGINYLLNLDLFRMYRQGFPTANYNICPHMLPLLSSEQAIICIVLVLRGKNTIWW